MNFVGQEFGLTNKNVVRAVIKQVCQRRNMQPVPPARVSQTSATKKQHVKLSESDAKKVWLILRRLVSTATTNDGSLCRKLLAELGSDLFTKALNMVTKAFKIPDLAVTQALILQVCEGKLKAFNATMRVKADAFGLKPPIGQLHAFRAEVKTNGNVTTSPAKFVEAKSILKFENGHIYCFLTHLKRSLTGCITLWQRMKQTPDNQRPVPIPNSVVTIKCIHRVRTETNSKLNVLSPCL